MNLEKGTKFYYADRNENKVILCEVIDLNFGHPQLVIAKRIDNKILQCYNGFGCFPLEQYDKALKDAQIQEDRIIY